MRRTMITLCLLGALVSCSKTETSSGAETTAAAVTTVATTGPATTGAATTSVPGSTTPDATRPSITLPDPTKPTFSTLPRENYNEADPGPVSGAVTSPVAVSGWGVAPVACTVSRRTYTASFEEAAVNETLAVSASIKVVNYTGPGTYPAVGSATILVPSGTYQVPLAGTVGIDGNLNGTVTVSTTVQSTAVAFTLTWYCSA